MLYINCDKDRLQCFNHESFYKVKGVASDGMEQCALSGLFSVISTL
jgi:hypothetical protein